MFRGLRAFTRRIFWRWLWSRSEKREVRSERDIPLAEVVILAWVFQACNREWCFVCGVSCFEGFAFGICEKSTKISTTPKREALETRNTTHETPLTITGLKNDAQNHNLCQRGRLSHFSPLASLASHFYFRAFPTQTGRNLRPGGAFFPENSVWHTSVAAWQATRPDPSQCRSSAFAAL